FTARANLEACREGTCSATDPAGSWRSAATIRRKSRRAGVAVPQRLTDRGRCAMATLQGSTRRRRNSAAWNTRRGGAGIRWACAGQAWGTDPAPPGTTLRRSESTIRVVMSTKTEVLPAEAWLRIDAEAEVQAIAEAVRSQLTEMLKRRGLVVAMSGGVDSSVAAGLAVRAVGPKRVFGVFMPEQDSDPRSLELAREWAEKLGIEHTTEDI